MKQKSVFPTIFILLAVLLMVLPFITTFNSFLTNFFLKFGFYQALEDFVVPYQAKAISSILALLPIPISVAPVAKGVWLNGQFISIEWNCIGWQSVVLLLATFLTGMGGKFSWSSRIETIIIGFVGTYLVNIFRLVAISLLTTLVGGLPTILVHEYLFTLIIVAWFFLFWWFAYSFVLETKDAD
jgi:exosortase/archaeosortase family protein